jgi:hypothetical protein
MMNEDQQEDQRLSDIKILQQNCRKSLICQLDTLSNLNPRHFDICLIQEPHIDHKGLTRCPPNWTAFYPPTHYIDNAPPTRSIILVSPLIGPEFCAQIPIDSPDVTAIQLETQQGSLRIFNVYNDINHSHSTDKLRAWHDNPRGNTSPPTPAFSNGRGVHTMWAGDFNQHHPAWDDDDQEQLFTAENIRNADKLLEDVAYAHLTMALPKGTNTLETAGGNWTRPDNVFMTHELLDHITICDVAADLRPVKADHMPIKITLDVGFEKSEAMESYKWKDVEWKDFQSDLADALRAQGPPRPLNSIHELEQAAIRLDGILQDLIAKHVETIRICGYTKRWWNTELASARKAFRSLKLKTYKQRGNPTHPVHAEARDASNSYHDLIDKTKALHWKKFIENTRDFNLWLTHKAVSGTGTDGGRTRLPAMRDRSAGQLDSFVTTNAEKAHILYTEFFPPPPATAPPVDEQDYPDEIEPFVEITDDQIHRAIQKMEAWKAVMKGDIPNFAVKKCAIELVPYLGEMYRASFRLGHYPSNWKVYDTIVLRKPERKDYTLPNAYRPICLLKTIAKPLSIVVTEYISHLAEKHHLLPNTHFGFRPGRATTDALLAVDKFVKDAWFKGDVVTGLFLDVKGAFPSVHIPRMTADLRRKGIPERITKWLKKKLEG